MRGYSFEGYWWIGYEHQGTVYLITRVARQGDCFRW